MTATTARRSNGRRTRERDAGAASKLTAHGRAVLRALDQMKATGPWQLGPKPSDRYFKNEQRLRAAHAEIEAELGRRRRRPPRLGDCTP
jgi:hypothetical protein